MRILRRVLSIEATLLALGGAILALFPGWLTETVFDQPQVPHAWMRIVGVQAIGFAMLYVITLRRLEHLWWAAWAFVMTGAGIALVAFLHAIAGLSGRVSTTMWWLLGAAAISMIAAILIGLAVAGTQRDPNVPPERDGKRG